MHPDAAGIDIGNESHYVAVPPDRDSHPVQCFGCTTAELKAMADWLNRCGIATVAMQSTGVYGLLRNSFRPTQEIRAMRSYWRQRNDLVHRQGDTSSGCRRCSRR